MDEADREELKYGPGYVKRMRDRYLALTRKWETQDLSNLTFSQSNCDQSDQAIHSFERILVERVKKEMAIIEQTVRKASAGLKVEKNSGDEGGEMGSVKILRQRFEQVTVERRDGGKEEKQMEAENVLSDQPDLQQQFHIIQGFSHPPPTPFPDPAVSTAPTFQYGRISPKRSSDSDHNDHDCDLKSSVFTLPLQTSHPPYDFYVGKPRALRFTGENGNVNSSDENIQNSNAFAEMKELVKKFRRSRREKLQMDTHQSNSSPVAAHSHQQVLAWREVFSFSDDSQDEKEMDTVGGTKKRLKKRRRVRVVGGGLVPRKTSLAHSPKLDTSKGLELSEGSPTAYAYLEESLACAIGQWIPGIELSLEEYHIIREETKRSRYNQFVTSPPRYIFRRNAAILLNPPISPMAHTTFYPAAYRPLFPLHSTISNYSRMINVARVGRVFSEIS